MNLYDIVSPMTVDEAKATKQRLDPKCWKGYKKQGTKVKGGVRVNNCVPNESATAPIIVPKRKTKEKEPAKFNIPFSADDYIPPALELASVEALDSIIADPATKEQTRELAKKAKSKKQGVAEDSWHAGDNAWSSENHEMVEGHSFSNGDQVELKPEYADRAGEVYTVSQCDRERGRCWIGDADGRGWYARFDQLVPAVGQDDVEEGWSDAVVAQRTGRPRTPYSVYIKGKKWKDFENDDHAEAVANKLRAKFKADGRDPSVITIAATDYDKDIKEGIVDTIRGKNYKRLANRSFGKAMNAQDKASKYDFADPKRFGHEDEFAQQMRKMRQREKKADELGVDDLDEAGSPAQQAAIAIAKKKEQGVAEAVSDKTFKELQGLFKQAKAGELKSTGVDFTKGDHWTGPDKDDPSYTRNFGHGYPNTPDNRSHDRYVNKSLKKDVDEADETSWTANSAQFRQEEDMSWPVEVTLEPKDDINQGRGAQVKTMTVTGQSRDAAKKKLVDYFRKNGWAVTGIKFTGDLDEGSFAHDQLKGEINDLFKPVVLQIVKWARAEGMTAKDLAGTSSHFFLDALDPDTYDRTQHLPDNYFNKLMDKANAKAVEILKNKGVAEDVSRLTDAEYNRVAGYVRKKYPGAQLSGLGRNEDGSFNVMIDTGSGRHEFKVRFRDPEETDIGEGWKSKAAAATVAGALASQAGAYPNPNRIIDGQGRSAANPYGNVDSQGHVIKKPEAPKADAPKEKETKKPVKESYWTKLQNERNTKLNSLVNELKESIKK